MLVLMGQKAHQIVSESQASRLVGGEINDEGITCPWTMYAAKDKFYRN